MLVLYALALTVTPSTAPAKDPPEQNYTQPVVKGTLTLANPRSLVAALQDAGYKATLVTKADSDPYITSSTAGATFDLKLLNCKDHKDCKDVMFQSSYEKRDKDPVTVEQINTFNREHRWARAYIDKDGSPVIEQDVLFTDQKIDEKMFSENLAVWDDMIGAFHKAIDF